MKTTKGAHWTGVEDAMRAIRGLGEIAAPQVLEAALLAVAKPIAEEMSAAAPRGPTGKTAASIRAAVVRDENDPMKVRVDVGARGGKKGRAYIVRWLEFGRIHQPARPFMRPVWDGHRERLARDFTAQLRPTYERVVKRLERFARKRGAGK